MPPSVSVAAQVQRDYYERTAHFYDVKHVKPDDEHARALGAFMGMADMLGPVGSVLDVGAGTGRALKILKRHWPDTRVIGIEPVAALRDIAYRHGVGVAELIEGDALGLDFETDAFDYVIETGMLHHVAKPERAIAEMVRVARNGVMISDVNNMASGPGLLKLVKHVAAALGLWPALIWLQTGGRMYKVDEGDGVFYSFSAFKHCEILRDKFPTLHFMNTVSCPSPNLWRSASGVMILALK